METEITERKLMLPPIVGMRSLVLRDTPSLIGRFVTAKLVGRLYPLQGWVISESPLRIRCSGGDEHDCEGIPTLVINPPDRDKEAGLPTKTG